MKPRGGWKGGGRLFKPEHQELQDTSESRKDKKETYKTKRIKFNEITNVMKWAITIPLAYSYSKFIGLTQYQFAILGLLKVFGSLRFIDFQSFGVLNSNVTNHAAYIDKLLEMEYIVPSVTGYGAKPLYTITKEGLDLVNRFQPYCDARIAEISNDYQNEKRLEQYWTGRYEKK